MRPKISDGTVHKIPSELKEKISLTPKVFETWEDITPLARNEWLCWIESCKKEDTRNRRIKMMFENLSNGKRRPCCWAGCSHR